MKTSNTLTFILLAIFCSIVFAEPEPVAELQGIWQATYYEREGKVEAADFQIIIQGSKIIVQIREKKEISNYTVDSTQSPKTIDIKHSDNDVFAGIYKIEGDILTLCGSIDKRPKTFEKGIAGQTLMILKKKVEPPEPQPQKIAELQGVWQATYYERQGKVEAADFQIMIQGSKIIVQIGQTKEISNYTVDSTQSPKTIDIKHSDNDVFVGIYKIEGDILTLCGSMDKRPKTFEKGIADQTLMILKKKVEPKKNILKPPEPQPQKIAELQGVWQAIHLEKEGTPGPEDTVKKVKLIIQGTDFIPQMDDEQKKFTYYADPTQSPKTIDIKSPDLVYYGIYKIEGDRLTLCIYQCPTPQDRPKDFETGRANKDPRFDAEFLIFQKVEEK